MGVSGRAAHVIDPRASDLLMPEQARRTRPSRVRDIEDASFEPIGRSRDAHTEPRVGQVSGRAFKSRLTEFPAEGPFPRDFARPDPASILRVGPNDRLGVFADGSKPPAPNRSGEPRTGAIFVVAVGLIAAAAFRMAGGHVLVLEPATQLRGPADAVPEASVTVVSQKPLPDPVMTSSIAAPPAPPAETSIIHPRPRPARIERAGSILMIRPNGN